MLGPMPSALCALFPLIFSPVCITYIVSPYAYEQNWDFRFLSGSRVLVLCAQHLDFQPYLYGPPLKYAKFYPPFAFLSCWHVEVLSSRSRVQGPLEVRSKKKKKTASLSFLTSVLALPANGRLPRRRSQEHGTQGRDSASGHRCPQSSACVASLPINSLPAGGTRTWQNSASHTELGGAGSWLPAEVVDKG